MRGLDKQFALATLNRPIARGCFWLERPKTTPATAVLAVSKQWGVSARQDSEAHRLHTFADRESPQFLPEIHIVLPFTMNACSLVQHSDALESRVAFYTWEIVFIRVRH